MSQPRRRCRPNAVHMALNTVHMALNTVHMALAEASAAADSRRVGARADTWSMDDMLGHTLSDGHRLRKLGPTELIAVRRAFNGIDSDGSGHLDIIEVRSCAGFGQPVPMSSVLTVLTRHAVRSAP